MPDALTPDGPDEALDADLAVRRAEALSSPLRWRILRLCLHSARTNAEISEALDINPGTTLRHVRLLSEAGFLAAQPERRGRQGAREIPYLATRLTWTGSPVEVAPVLVHTLLDEIAPLEPRELEAWRLGVRLSPDDLADVRDRLTTVFAYALERDTDAPDALPYSLTAFLHPDRGAGASVNPP